MTVWTERGSWIVPSTWAIWAPAHVRHGIRAAGYVAIRMLYLRPADSAGLPDTPTVIRVSPLLRELTIRAVEIGMLDDREPIHRAIATLILESLSTEAAQPFDVPMPAADPLRSLARQLLADPQARQQSPGDIAAGVAMSTRTFQRAFLRATGVSFGRWRRSAALIDSLRMLAAGTPVKLTAARSGFHSASAFVFAFRNTFGRTPGQYFTSPTDTE
jgi:AraC-like DNA-binding protein